MTKYERELLNTLLDKYEKSKSFIGANQVNQSFTQTVDKLFPKYKDDSEYHLFCEVNESVASLENLGFVKVKRQKSGVVQSVTLNAEYLENIYRYIGRIPKRDIVSDVKKLLSRYQDANEILSVYCNRQMGRLEENKSVEFFDDDFHEYESLLKVISEILDVKNETFERDFSIRVLGDSKAFEKIRAKVVSLLYEYGDFPEKETLLADLNIIKNPGHVYFKGKGRMAICGQTIDFSNMNGDLAISSDLLKQVDRIEAFGKVVITIENLTTFNAFRCDDSFAIYLGGYHNTDRRNFIRKVYEQNPNKRYLHFGDVDAGGFSILQHLRNRTGIEFEPYRMDLHTLKDNVQYVKKLTEHDRKRLLVLVDTEFRETVEYMLENNCKLEQEAMDLSGVGI
ncbi:MAG: DUF2399 domain-containing protein [Clostridia bacterium]|nr:DUF2399 domain-containing protein [Clostridia bacterium]